MNKFKAGDIVTLKGDQIDYVVVLPKPDRNNNIITLHEPSNYYAMWKEDYLVKKEDPIKPLQTLDYNKEFVSEVLARFNLKINEIVDKINELDRRN